jgi:hypothetical protein
MNAKEYLEKARVVARRLAKKGPVAADDVQKKFPRPESLNPNILGGLFTKEFKHMGYKKSTLPKAKGRIIKIYKLRH